MIDNTFDELSGTDIFDISGLQAWCSGLVSGEVHHIKYQYDVPIDYFNITFLDTLSTVIDVPISLNLSSYYNKDEFDSKYDFSFDDIISLSASLTSLLQNYYLDEIPEDLSFDILPSTEIKFLSSEFPINIKPYYDIDFKVIVPDKISADFSNKMSALESSVIDITNKVEGLREIEQYKKYGNVKFTCINKLTGENVSSIDKVLINGKEVAFTSETINGITTFYVSGIFTNPYKITIIKDRYGEFTFYIRAKIAKSLDDVPILNLGVLELFNESEAFTFVLEWGEKPLDLDFHVFCLDSNLVQMEHIYFDHLYSYISDMKLDIDDKDSFGPEKVKINNLDKENYYIFSVHNYSYRHEHNPEDAVMNYGNKTKMSVYIKDERKVEVIPYSSGTSLDYWWDGFVVHDRKIYIINEFASLLRTADENFSFNNGPRELRNFFEKFNNASIIYDFDDLLIDLKN